MSTSHPINRSDSRQSVYWPVSKGDCEQMQPLTLYKPQDLVCFSCLGQWRDDRTWNGQFADRFWKVEHSGGALLLGWTPGDSGAPALTRPKMGTVFYLWKYIFLPMLFVSSSTHNCSHGIETGHKSPLPQFQLTFNVAKHHRNQGGLLMFAPCFWHVLQPLTRLRCSDQYAELYFRAPSSKRGSEASCFHWGFS
jgi:hypothetical protein